MRRPLPPLSSLRAFEAVARQLSFSRATEELNVTPGAVSQQIRALEQLLGSQLFDRTRRSVSLSDVGARMLPDVQAGLEILSRAVNSKTTAVGERTLTISVAPSFQSKWLLPRLPRFHERHPDIDLRISATVGLADFRREKVDLAIRLGGGNYPGLYAEPLFAEALTPLCSPGLLKRKGALKKPDDLRRHRLIHDTSIPGYEQGAWERWLALAGGKNISTQRGTRFTLAEADLAAGRLVRPFKTVLHLDARYFLVRPKVATPRHELRCFRDWLFSSLSNTSDSNEAP